MSTEKPPFIARRKIYDQVRFEEALRAALMAAVIAFFAGLLLLRGQEAERIPINPPLEVTSEVDGAAGIDTDAELDIQPDGGANTPTNLIDEPPAPIPTAQTEESLYSIATVYQTLGSGLWAMVTTLLSPPNGMTIAWYIRCLAVIITPIIVILYFRGRLSERHELELDNIRTDLFKYIHHTSSWMIIPIFISFLLLTYIMASALSRLLELMFVGLTLSALETGVVGIVFAGLLAYVLVHYISVVNTSDILYIGYMIIIMGFAWGFSIAEQSSDIPNCGSYWYCHSISNTGIQKSSGIIFTLTMIGMGTFLWLVWRDISLILKSLFDNEHVLTGQPEPKTPPELPHWKLINYGMNFAFLMITCIGLVPTFDNVYIFGIVPLSTIHLGFAFGGPILLIVFGKFAVTNISRRLLPSHFWYATCGLLAADVIAFILFLLWKFQINIGIPTLNVTAFELVILGLVGIWFYGIVYYSVAIIDGLESDQFANGSRSSTEHSSGYYKVAPIPATANLYIRLQQLVVQPIENKWKQPRQQSQTEKHPS
jgi:hypothetical protein